MLADIPAPQVLDPGRVSRDDREDMTAEDHRNQSQLYADALDQTCAYAQQLWNDLAAVRQYLYDSLPPESAHAERDSSGAPTVGVSPRGPDDDEGWERWEVAFGEVTSVLCGPHGDSGFGRQNARELAHTRRLPVDTDARTSADSAADTAAAASDQASTTAVDEPAVPGAVRAAAGDLPGAPAAMPAAAATSAALRQPLIYSLLGAAVTAFVMRGRRRPE